MSKTIGPFRHLGVAAVLGARGFEPSRGTRDAIHFKVAPLSRSKPVLDDAAMARAIKAGIAKGFDTAIAKLRAGNPGSGSGPAKIATETPSELKDRIASAVQARRAATFRGAV